MCLIFDTRVLLLTQTQKYTAIKTSVLCIRPLTFSCSQDKVQIFDLILLKLAHIVCIIVRINPVENEENPSHIMGKESF